MTIFDLASPLGKNKVELNIRININYSSSYYYGHKISYANINTQGMLHQYNRL